MKTTNQTIKKLLASVETKEYFEQQKIKYEQGHKYELRQIHRIERWLSNKTTPKINMQLTKIVKKCKKASYIEKFYKKGEMPRPSNLLEAIFSFIEKKGKKLKSGEFGQRYRYKDYTYEELYGQGIAQKLTYKNKFMICI